MSFAVPLEIVLAPMPPTIRLSPLPAVIRSPAPPAVLRSVQLVPGLRRPSLPGGGEPDVSLVARQAGVPVAAPDRVRAAAADDQVAPVAERDRVPARRAAEVDRLHVEAARAIHDAVAADHD